MFPFPPAIPAIPVSLASQTSLKAAMPNACMLQIFAGMQAEKLRVSHCPPPGAQLLSILAFVQSLARCKHSGPLLALYHCPFRTGSSLKFFLRSWRVFPTSSPLALINLVCFLQISMTASTQPVGIPNVPGFPPATYSIKCPSTGSKQPSKRKRRMNMNHWKSVCLSPWFLPSP